LFGGRIGGGLRFGVGGRFVLGLVGGDCGTRGCVTGGGLGRGFGFGVLMVGRGGGLVWERAVAFEGEF
jgi:hypothetical protein